ncbi:MAG: hypothetical protein WCV88_06130 [Patescibacteria group bacterium]|jgi:hypothetical protein
MKEFIFSKLSDIPRGSINLDDEVGLENRFNSGKTLIIFTTDDVVLGQDGGGALPMFIDLEDWRNINIMAQLRVYANNKLQEYVATKIS